MIVKTSRLKSLLKAAIILSLIFVIIFLMYSIDNNRCKNNMEPIFTFFTIYYKDGGTKYKVGIGYSVISWRKLAIINLNNTEILGYRIGKEVVNFPLCYINIFRHDIKPTVELQFISDEAELVDVELFDVDYEIIDYYETKVNDYGKILFSDDNTIKFIGFSPRINQ